MGMKLDDIRATVQDLYRDRCTRVASLKRSFLLSSFIYRRWRNRSHSTDPHNTDPGQTHSAQLYLFLLEPLVLL